MQCPSSAGARNYLFKIIEAKLGFFFGTEYELKIIGFQRRLIYKNRMVHMGLI